MPAPLGAIQDPFKAPNGQFYDSPRTYQFQQLLERILSEGQSQGLSQAQYTWLVDNGYKSAITPQMLRTSQAWFNKPLAESEWKAFNETYKPPAGSESMIDKIVNTTRRSAQGALGFDEVSRLLSEGKTPTEIAQSRTYGGGQGVGYDPTFARPAQTQTPWSAGDYTASPDGVPSATRPGLPRPTATPGYQQPAPMIGAVPQSPGAGRTPPPLATGMPPMAMPPQYNANQQARVNQLNQNAQNVFGTVVPSTVTYGQPSRATRIRTRAYA